MRIRCQKTKRYRAPSDERLAKSRKASLTTQRSLGMFLLLKFFFCVSIAIILCRLHASDDSAYTAAAGSCEAAYPAGRDRNFLTTENKTEHETDSRPVRTRFVGFATYCCCLLKTAHAEVRHPILLSRSRYSSAIAPALSRHLRRFARVRPAMLCFCLAAVKPRA